MIGGARTIKIHGEYIPVEAEVANLTMLSAHADSDELMRWLGSLHEAPRHVYVTHGEPTGAQVLAKRVSEELGWACSVPALGRSEERRVGKECVSTCRSRGSPDH